MSKRAILFLGILLLLAVGVAILLAFLSKSSSNENEALRAPAMNVVATPSLGATSPTDAVQTTAVINSSTVTVTYASEPVRTASSLEYLIVVDHEPSDAQRASWATLLQSHLRGYIVVLVAPEAFSTRLVSNLAADLPTQLSLANRPSRTWVSFTSSACNTDAIVNELKANRARFTGATEVFLDPACTHALADSETALEAPLGPMTFFASNPATKAIDKLREQLRLAEYPCTRCESPLFGFASCFAPQASFLQQNGEPLLLLQTSDLPSSLPLRTVELISCRLARQEQR